MAVQRVNARQAVVAGALVVGLLAASYVGVRYIQGRSWGLVYEIAYVLALLIGFGVVADRLFVR